MTLKLLSKVQLEPRTWNNPDFSSVHMDACEPPSTVFKYLHWCRVYFHFYILWTFYFCYLEGEGHWPALWVHGVPWWAPLGWYCPGDRMLPTEVALSFIYRHKTYRTWRDAGEWHPCVKFTGGNWHSRMFHWKIWLLTEDGLQLFWWWAL